MKLFVITALWFFAFSTVMAQESKSADARPDAAQDGEAMEKLYGLYIKKDRLHFKVTSFGCTEAEDFMLKSGNGSPGKENRVEIVREKTDRCRRMPTQLWLSLPLENATSRIYILNPFSAPKGKH